MRYTVLWTPVAEERLAALWLSADDRAALTSAANAIDRILTHDPENAGILCFDTVRTLNLHPLGVDFEVVETESLVHVLTVRYESSSTPE